MQSAKVTITKRNIDKIMTAIKKRIAMRMMLQNEINKMVASLEGTRLHYCSCNLSVEHCILTDGQTIDPGPDSNQLFPGTYHSKLVRFKKLTKEEALSHVRNKKCIMTLTSLSTE